MVKTYRLNGCKNGERSVRDKEMLCFLFDATLHKASPAGCSFIFSWLLSSHMVKCCKERPTVIKMHRTEWLFTVVRGLISILSWRCPLWRDRVNFHREQRNFFHLTELEVRTTFMFWRRYKISVKNPATNWSVWCNFGGLMEDGAATLP